MTRLQPWFGAKQSGEVREFMDGVKLVSKKTETFVISDIKVYERMQRKC